MRAWLVILILSLAAVAARAEDLADMQRRNDDLRHKLAQAQARNREEEARREAKAKFDREGADNSKDVFRRLGDAFLEVELEVTRACTNEYADFGGINRLITMHGRGPAHIAAGQMSQGVNAIYRGSSIDCWLGEGVFVASDGTQYVFRNAALVGSIRDTTANGLRYEVTDRAYQLRISHPSGSYIVISGKGQPTYIDAKLPITLHSVGAQVAGGRGGGNEMAQALNDVYATLKPQGGKYISVLGVAEDLLLSQGEREAFVERYRQLRASAAK